MNKTLGILFYTKNAKINKQGLIPIYLRITVDGARSEISINRYIAPDKWNQKAQKCIGTTDIIKSINFYLDTLKAKVLENQRNLIDHNKQVTAIAIKEAMLGLNEKGKTIVEVFEKHNLEMKAQIGHEFALGTYTRYKTTLMHVTNFMKLKYKTISINIKDLDYSFIVDFEYYLRTERNIANNSAVKYVKNLQKIVNIALSRGYIDKNPFINYKSKMKEVVKFYLSKEELKAIEDKVIENERMDSIRDIFLFSCYTGLAYIDTQKLNKSNIVKDDNGEDWLNVFRTKTKILCRIPLLPIPQRILKKYAHNPKCLNKNVLLPVLTNQKMNIYLKELAAICGINKNLTHHIARHTFGSTVTLSNNVPLESVSSMMGHTNIHMTQKYAKIVNAKLINDMKKLKELL